MNLSDFAILNIKGSNYCCIICGIRKSEAKNTNLIKKMENYKSKKKKKKF